MEDQQSDQLPDQLDKLSELIRIHHDQMPKRLRATAQFALGHPEQMALGTLADLSEQAGLTPSTFVRFAKYLGYSGFSQMQTVFRSKLMGSWSSYEKRLDDIGSDQSGHMLDQICASAARSSMRLTEQLDRVQAKKAASLIANAGVVWLAASGRCAPVAAYLTYIFTRLGIRSVRVSANPPEASHQMRLIARDDLLLAISFAPYSAVTAELVAMAKKKRQKCVSITDTEVSPLDYGVRLLIQEEDFAGFRSLSALMTLAQYLALEAGQERTGKIRSGQQKSGQTIPGQTIPGQTKPGQTKPGRRKQ